MAYMNARNGVNSLFGTFDVAQDTGIVTLNNADEPMLDYIMRGKDGIQRKILKSDRIVTAIADGPAYLRAKRADLSRILRELNDDFKSVYRAELARGLPHKETKKNTVEEVDRRLDRKLKLHLEKYPDELTKRIVKKLTG